MTAWNQADRVIVAEFKNEYGEALLASDFIIGYGYGYPPSDLDLSGPTGVVVYCDRGKLEEAKHIVPFQYKGLYVFLEESDRPQLQ